MKAYFIIDDWCDSLNREGFAVMYGNPETAIGTQQGEYRTLSAALAAIPKGEPIYRVWVARRHGEFRVRYMGTAFRDAKGWLTPYALACGYREYFNWQEDSVCMYRDGCLHVVHMRGGLRVSWENPETLSKARKLYAATMRQIKRGKK